MSPATRPTSPLKTGWTTSNASTKGAAIHTYKDGVSHGGTYSQPNGGDFARVAVAMLKWQFKDDKEASKMFIGAKCGLCQDPKWHVSTKGLQ